jgi:hypothetical protein
MKTYIPINVGLFYDLSDGIFLPIVEISEFSELHIAEIIPAADCMFTINWVELDGVKCGYLFNSKFEIINNGGFITTFLQSGKGKASNVEVLAKSEHLILYHFPNRGSMAVSPIVNSTIANVFESQ